VRPLVFRPSRLRFKPPGLHCERPRLHFEPLKHFNFHFNADRDPASKYNADPDPNSTLDGLTFINSPL
jgi:hypothetical protein